MNFGIPKQRVRKEEFHSNQPVMRMTVAGDKGTARKFMFNSLASEMLGLNDEVEGNHQVSLSFDNGLYIANTTGTDVEQYKITLGKPHSFSNKKLHDYIMKTVEGLNTEDTNDFLLANAPNVESSLNVLSLTLLQSGEEYTEVIGINEPYIVEGLVEESNESADMEDAVKPEPEPEPQHENAPTDNGAWD